MVYLINTQEMIKQILEKLEYIESILREQQKQPLTIEEASSYLNLSKKYLYKLTCTNKIPYYKPNGRKIYFKKSELEEWIFQHRIKSGYEIEKEADEYIRKHPRKY